MRKNACGVERVIRFLLGLAIGSLFFVLHGPARYLGLIGLAPIITAITGYCPLNALLGRNSCRGK